MNRPSIWKKLSGEKTFKDALTVFLAGMTIVAASIVLANVRVLARGAAASRDSRILAIRYLTHLGRSLWDTAAEKNLMVAAQETAGLIMQAEAYEKMSQGIDAALYRITRNRLAQIKDIIAAEGRISKPPYYDSRLGTFDLARYYLDRVFIPAAELLERQEQKKREGAFWGVKSDAYATGLAVLAVAVFLLTLSLVLSGKIRFLMAGVGLALVTAVASMSAVTAARPWRGRSDESVRELARAAGDTLQARLVLDYGGDLNAVEYFAGEAAKKIELILKRDPNYTAAVELRARLRSTRGEALFFDGKTAAGRDEIAAGAADLESVLRSGKDDGYIRWSLGSAELLLGRTAEARASIDKALTKLPEHKMALGILRAAALRLGGGKAEADQALEAALAHAAAKPLASDPVFFRTFIRNFERIVEIVPSNGLEAMVRRLKEASVSIAQGKGPRPQEVSSRVKSLQFVNPVYDKMGEITAVPPCAEYPRLTARAHFLVEYAGMSKGQSIVLKVLRRLPGQVFWTELLRLGRSQHWDAPEEKTEGRLLGSIEYPMPEAGEILSTGEYRVEIYLEGNLAVTGTFRVL